MRTIFFILITFIFVSCSNVNKTENVISSNNQTNNKINNTTNNKISNKTNNKNYNFISKHKIPSLLIGYGILTHQIQTLRNIDFKIKNKVNEKNSEKHTIDDFTQYMPFFSAFSIDEEYPSLHNKEEKIVIAGTSLLTTAVLVSSIKNSTKIMRPDGSAKNSFPSGHTATAFAGAHFLYKEYNDVNPTLAKSGYFIAGLTGALRVTNNRHWFSDVVAVAGVGIVSTEISYSILPKVLEFFSLEDSFEDISLFPIITKDGYGFQIMYKI